MSDMKTGFLDTKTIRHNPKANHITGRGGALAPDINKKAILISGARAPPLPVIASSLLLTDFYTNASYFTYTTKAHIFHDHNTHLPQP